MFIIYYIKYIVYNTLKNNFFAKKVLTLGNFKRRDILFVYFSNLAAAGVSMSISSLLHKSTEIY